MKTSWLPIREKRKFRQDLQDAQDEMPREDASPNGVARFICWSSFPSNKSCSSCQNSALSNESSRLGAPVGPVRYPAKTPLERRFFKARVRAHRHGMTLMEILVYIALLAVVLGAATKTFYECLSQSNSLRRNADDVARALDIGERWRADVRAATGPIQKTEVNGAAQIHIPSAQGEIIYTAAKGELLRQAGSAARGTVWLADVKASHMQSETRGSVTAWRWELELRSALHQPRLRPLFTFISVAGGAPQR
jgi:Tfp pilus assembly protein FimT